MKILHLFTLLLIGSLIPYRAFSQYEVVEFDYQNAYFNNGQPLPAETKLIISGVAKPDIGMVEMHIFKAGANQDKAPLYQSTWRRESGDPGEKFTVPVAFQLHGSTDYDFVISYYREIAPAERAELEQALFETLGAYIDHSITPKSDQLKLTRSPQVMISDMDEIVRQGLVNYYAGGDEVFRGFSDMVKDAIDNAKKYKKPAPAEPVSTAPAVNFDPEKGLMIENPYLADLKRLVKAEAIQALNGANFVKTRDREVLGYGTETGRRALALNIGYGGVFIDGGAENASYDTAPYLGISFPLANRAYASRFWSNASISVGVFTQDFENADSVKISGPIFGRPYYVGLGYNIFRFFKINAGAAITEKKGSSSIGGGNASIDVSGISIRPFVGLSAEIDLWLGFRERR